LGQMIYAFTTKSNWWGFIGKSLIWLVVVLLLFSFFMFMLVNRDLLGKGYIYPLIHDRQELIRDDPGLSAPLVAQYGRLIGGIFTADWGLSFYPESYYSK
jgi:ABC-type dipeptide/oligopeptide/nickel transport system permease component